MDNITHTVIALVAGDAVHNATNPRQMPSLERRSLFLLSSVMANNLPDLDVFFAKTLPVPLGSLLHHRGMTHTLIMVLPQAVLITLILLLLRGSILSKRLSLRDWLLAGFTAILGICLHVFADSWNSYGVHPFYPINNNWYYGDFIFVVEPLFWAIGGAWILLELSFWWRLLFFAAFSFFIGYGYNLEALDKNSIIVLVTILLSLTLILGAISTSRRAIVTIAVSILLLCGFHSQSYKVKEMIKQEYEKHKLSPPLDVATSPSAGNPFCWTVFAASKEHDRFVIRKASISLWESYYSAESCRFLDKSSSSVTTVTNTAEILWFREFQTPLAAFKIYSSDCFFRDWLRFARLPFIFKSRAQDVRFSGRGTSNFSELALQPGRKYLAGIPPWNSPRKDLEIE